MMKLTGPEKLKMVYGLAKKAGMTGRQGNEDLHALATSLCGKESLKELTEKEYAALLQELRKRAGTTVKASKGITKRQINKVWQLMYELKKYDQKPSETALGDRLCGIIKKELGIDALKKEPFIWLTYSDGSKLIEKIKKYIDSAKKRASKNI